MHACYKFLFEKRIYGSDYLKHINTETQKSFFFYETEEIWSWTKKSWNRTEICSLPDVKEWSIILKTIM